MPVVSRKVVVEAGQGNRPEDAGGHYDRTQAAAADHQALLDQVLHRLPDGGAAHAEAFGQVQFVVQPVPGLERPVLDGLLEVLGDLEVQRDGAVAVERSLGHGASQHAGSLGSRVMRAVKGGSQLSLYCPDLLTYY